MTLKDLDDRRRVERPLLLHISGLIDEIREVDEVELIFKKDTRTKRSKRKVL